MSNRNSSAVIFILNIQSKHQVAPGLRDFGALVRDADRALHPPPSPSSSLSCLVLRQKKEKSESERLLTEQLQAKELELLQLKTEMDISQGTGRALGVRIYTLTGFTTRGETSH